MTNQEFNIAQMARAARRASRTLAIASSEQKNQALHAMADALLAGQNGILAANRLDMQAAQKDNLSAAMQDRLLLNPARIEQMAQALNEVAGQDDPVGQISQSETRPNGMQVAKMRVPLGVVAMIYEARPNVTAEAAALCLKSGNAVILRGGKEALNSSLAIAHCLHKGLAQAGLDPDILSVVPNPDRRIMNTMLTLSDDIDLVIPRGGEGLIRFVSQNSRIPVIQHYKGVCHLYVDGEANQTMALDILLNGKTQRPGVCNSLETLLVDAAIAAQFLPTVAGAFAQQQVKVHACAQSLAYFDDAELATLADYDAEYLALEIAVKVVDGFDDALAHIGQYSSHHTEVIVTENADKAQRFIRAVDSSVVMHNTSSRFSDGGQLGLGAEIGISTTKLHAYGPMGATALTTEKFVVTGQGQIRE